MSKVVIIGSGASGVHFALSVLKKAHDVTMLDVGKVRPPVVNPDDTFGELKRNLPDPAQYFLGSDFESVLQPGSKGEYYGFPPNKRYIFSRPTNFDLEASGFAPLSSFARGGLAEAWTGGVYPLNENELKSFPFPYKGLARFYGEVAKRIGITGVDDDLARFYPVHEHLMAPLRLDKHSQKLLTTYEAHKNYLNNKLKCYVGRSRVATLSKDTKERKGCSYCGRCLWGCPSGAFYTPSLTLEQCFKFPNFTYISNAFVNHFKLDSQNKIESVVFETMPDGGSYEITADNYVLAAGTLSSSKIYMDSIWKATGEVIKLGGLMDNRQILIPFININLIGKPYDESYQYHQVALGIEDGEPDQYIHGQITTLKSALVHPIVQNIPLDLRTSMKLFRNVRSGLGVVNVNLGDYRRDTSYLTLKTDHTSGRSRLCIVYSPPADEQKRIKRAVKLVKKSLWQLGCIVPPGMMHVRPMGASVHYAGTIPMNNERLPHTSTKFCQSHDVENLYFVDGTTFPSLPAKNITFALMSNAVRVAEEAF